MSPNVPDIFSSSALSLTREKSASSLMQLVMYSVPRIVSHVTFRISEAHLFLSMCPTKSLFEEKELHPLSRLVPALQFRMAWDLQLRERKESRCLQLDSMSRYISNPLIIAGHSR